VHASGKHATKLRASAAGPSPWPCIALGAIGLAVAVLASPRRKGKLLPGRWSKSKHPRLGWYRAGYLPATNGQARLLGHEPHRANVGRQARDSFLASSRRRASPRDVEVSSLAACFGKARAPIQVARLKRVYKRKYQRVHADSR
jgi:hypothetical protein